MFEDCEWVLDYLVVYVLVFFIDVFCVVLVGDSVGGNMVMIIVNVVLVLVFLIVG